MFSSPFGSATLEVDDSCDVVFVSDMFADEYVGGAELTSQALIDSCPLKVQKVKSSQLTMELMERLSEKYWVFGNFAQVQMELLTTAVANLKYSVLEYDYKYCKYRSPQKHKVAEGTDCDCQSEMHGKLISAFYYGAQSLWWMSEAQQEHYHRLFPFLAEKQSVVLSSVFDDRFFAAVKVLMEEQRGKDRKGWLVLGSNSWVKGAGTAEQYCKDNGLDYEVVWNLPYPELLRKLSQAEGFVYLPSGWDTCPRMVIEAKLLGCQLIINDNVQHAREDWFTSADRFDTEAYLYAARDRFWDSIIDTMEYNPSISGYTTTRNCNQHQYPWRQSIKSMLGFCDEVVVVDGGSTDGTLEDLQKWAEEEPRLKVHLVERDWDHPRFAVFDGAQKAAARSRCTGDFLWQQDADEVVHEKDYQNIKDLCTRFPAEVDLLCLPVIEYWGGPEKVRMDVNPWKWRLSRNRPHITHGIPAQLQRTDADGNLYASPGTDGCDYVHTETGELIPHANFYTQQVHQIRMAALTPEHPQNSEAQTAYTEWFKGLVEALPGVHHYSWFDLPRKIRTYRDYWSQHWQSLYDITQEDTAENNMFFQRPWSEVTEADVEGLAARLRDEMGGWVFHQPVDFSKPTPSIALDIQEPLVVRADGTGE